MKKDKKIGIITHYHGSLNYGGVLQAYALCKFLNQNGISSEQIDYDYLGEIHHKANKDICLPKRFIICLKKHFHNLFLQTPEEKKLKRRKLLFKAFRDDIPHTRKTYCDRNIISLYDKYDCCVVGSDQVWNPEWFCEPFFLTFTSSNVKRVSYAASLGKQFFSPNQKKLYESLLSNFEYISVRERSAAVILGEVTEKKIEILLDPTLLLDKRDWDLITPRKLVSDKYVFCYFLSKDKYLRKLAESFAKSKGLVLVILMHADGYCEDDISVSGVRIYDAGPMEFLSLIKYAEYTLTDSFHASVFSCIFGKQFYVFGRTDKPGMSERLIELATLFCINSHIIMPELQNKENYMKECDDIVYDKQLDTLLERRKESRQFLFKAIKYSGYNYDTVDN